MQTERENMKVTVDDLSSVKKTLQIEVPQDEISNQLDDAYKNLKKNAKIKGFRPGKAPRSVLERLFKKDVHADITSNLIQSSFIEAIQETGLNIVGTPKIDPPELKPGEAYHYEASVEIRPEIQDVDFKGLSLTKTAYKVSDAEIDTQLKMLQKNLAQRKPITDPRPVQDGDFVLIDYEGLLDGKVYAPTQKTENFLMQIGKGTISPDFDEKLVGQTPGETLEFTVKFPEDHVNEDLAEKEVAFSVSLNEIREEVLPDIDDEMAKRLGQFETIDALKKEIVDNLKQGYDKRSEHEINEQIFTALIEKTEFEVPDALVEMELDGIIQETERSFSMQGISMADLGLSREIISEKHRDTADKQVRRHLILDKIIKQEELVLSDEALEKGFADMAQASRQPEETIKEYYNKNAEGLEFFKHTLLEKEAIRLIIENSEVEEKEPDTKPAED